MIWNHFHSDSGRPGNDQTAPDSLCFLTAPDFDYQSWTCSDHFESFENENLPVLRALDSAV